MTKRIDAIVKSWQTGAKYRGGEDAKRFRGNLKRASTAASECARLFDGFEGQDRIDRADDIETLRKAAKLLEALADDFEVAQRKTDKIKKDAEREAQDNRAKEVAGAIKELFGDSPDPDAVFAMASDLVYFDGAGSYEFGRTKGCQRGLLSGSWNIGELRYAVSRKDLKTALKLIAENRLESRWPGRAGGDIHKETYWHAGWDDFLLWRKNRT